MADLLSISKATISFFLSLIYFPIGENIGNHKFNFVHVESACEHVPYFLAFQYVMTENKRTRPYLRTEHIFCDYNKVSHEHC